MAHEEFQSDLDELLRAAELACVSGSQQLLEKVRCFAGKYTASAPVSHCPSDAELRVLSKECEKMPGGLGMHYVNYGRAVLARWGCVRDRVVKESSLCTS